MQYIYVLIRCFIIFMYMSFMLRFLGKKEVGQLGVFDLVLILIISDIASMGIEEESNFVFSILCLSLLVVLQKCFSFLMLKNASIREILDNTPTVIVKDGVILYKNMKKESYTIDDLITQMRNCAVMDIFEIRLAVLEGNGNLSVFRKNEYDNVVLPVIKSGKICKINCELLNLTKDQVEIMALQRGKKIKKIIYASSNGIDLNISNKF